MKKVLCIMLLMSILILSVTADPISFGIGNFTRHIDSLYDGIPAENLLDPSFYRFGTDARFQVFFMELAMNGVFTNNNEFFNGMVTLGFHVPIFGFLDVGIGVGPYYGLLFDTGEVTSYRHFINDEFPLSWYYTPVESFMDIFTDSVMGYRLHLDVLISKISFGVSLDIPSMGYTISDNDPQALNINTEKMRIGLSAMYWFF